MNKTKWNKNQHICLYIFILLICGIALGILLSKYIDIKDTDQFKSYLMVLLENKHQKDYFVSQFMIGIISIFSIVLFGTSFLGIPIISFVIFTKGVQIGFTSVLFVLTYSYMGIVAIFLVFIPLLFLDLLAFYIISHFSILFSMNLIHVCTTQNLISFKQYFNKVLNVLILCLLITILSSYFKTTLGITFIKIFESMI